MREPGHYQNRLSSDPSLLIQEAYGSPHLAAEAPLLEHHLAAHRAHVVMLAERGIVATSDAAAILSSLGHLEQAGSVELPLRPEFNDLFTCTDIYLIQTLGEAVGGRLHTGRSRNDFSLTLARIVTREALLGLSSSVVHLRSTLLALAVEHVDTIFPGYTHHSQQAQPVTFAHFLLAHQDGLGRDLERLEGAYERTNRCPMGGVALAGTGFPIDRERVAELLGFDSLVENTQDACGSRDFQLETAAAAVILCSTIGRLAESLILYTSAEFDYVELDDSHSSVSSVMPQKKNPVSLEIVEAMHARAAGGFTTMVTLLKSATLGNSRQTGYCDSELQGVLSTTSFAVRITDQALAGLRVKRDNALRAVADGMSTATELADRLVRKHGLPFRQAHRIVGLAVSRALASDDRRLSAELVNQAAREVGGLELSIDEAFVTAALDPWQNVFARQSRGGPAPIEVWRMIEDRYRALDRDRDRLAELNTGVQSGRDKLRDAVRRLQAVPGAPAPPTT